MVLTAVELHSVVQAPLKLKRSDVLCLSSARVKGVHRVPSLPSSSQHILYTRLHLMAVVMLYFFSSCPVGAVSFQCHHLKMSSFVFVFSSCVTDSLTCKIHLSVRMSISYFGSGM